MVASRFYNWKILWPYVLLECESIWNVVPLWPGRGDVRQILSPLSSFVANGSSPVSLHLSLYISLSLSSAFVVENLLEGRLRCLWYLRDYARSLLAVTRARSPNVRSLSSFVVALSRIFTDPKLRRGTGTVGGECGVLTYNASIKVKRRAYVQRTSPSCSSTESVQQLRVKGTIKNVLRQVKVHSLHSVYRINACGKFGCAIYQVLRII